MVITVFEMEGKRQICVWSQERAKRGDVGKRGIKSDPQMWGLRNWARMVMIPLKNPVAGITAPVILSVW